MGHTKDDEAPPTLPRLNLYCQTIEDKGNDHQLDCIPQTRDLTHLALRVDNTPSREEQRLSSSASISASTAVFSAVDPADLPFPDDALMPEHGRELREILNSLSWVGVDVLTTRIHSGKLSGEELEKHLVTLKFLLSPSGEEFLDIGRRQMEALQAWQSMSDSGQITQPQAAPQAPQCFSYPQSNNPVVSSSPKPQSQRCARRLSSTMKSMLTTTPRVPGPLQASALLNDVSSPRKLSLRRSSLPQSEPCLLSSSSGGVQGRRHSKRSPGTRKPISTIIPEIPKPSQDPTPLVDALASRISPPCAFMRYDDTGAPLGRCGEILPTVIDIVQNHIQSHMRSLGVKGATFVVCPFCEKGCAKKQYRELWKHIGDTHYRIREALCPCGGVIVRGSCANSVRRHNETEIHRRWVEMTRENEGKRNGPDDSDREEGSSNGRKRRRRE